MSQADLDPAGGRRGGHYEALVEAFEGLGAARDLDDETGGGCRHGTQATITTEAFYISLLVLTAVVITWFAGYVVYRLVRTLPLTMATFVLDPDLPPALAPLAWSSASGRAPASSATPRSSRPTSGRRSASPMTAGPGGQSRTWLLDEQGNKVRPLARLGFWRPLENNEVEFLLTHPTGIVDVPRHDVPGEDRDPHRRRHPQPARQ